MTWTLSCVSGPDDDFLPITFLLSHQIKKFIRIWVKPHIFGPAPSHACPVAWPVLVIDTQVSPCHSVCSGGLTLVFAWAPRVPSALHIHQLVSLSAGQFIINSCWLVKSGPGRGTHTYIYIHCEDPLAVDGFQRPWTHPLPLNDGHSPESSNTYSVNLLPPSPSSLTLSCFFPHSVSLPFLVPPLLSTFCHHVRNFCIKSSPSGLRGGNMKMKCGHGWPCAVCVCHACLAEVEM